MMKVTVAKKLTIEEAKTLFGKEFEEAYRQMEPDEYTNPGDHIITKSGLVLLVYEE